MSASMRLKREGQKQMRADFHGRFREIISDPINLLIDTHALAGGVVNDGGSRLPKHRSKFPGQSAYAPNDRGARQDTARQCADPTAVSRHRMRSQPVDVHRFSSEPGRSPALIKAIRFVLVRSAHPRCNLDHASAARQNSEEPVVAHYVPMPDRQAGMLRFFRLLSIFAEQYEVSFFALQMDDQNREIGEEAIGEYTRQLVSAGISFNQGSRVELTRFVGRRKFDVVFFEHYQFALPFIDEVRYFQPRAKIVIDTIDLNYLRLASKAEVSQHHSDRAEATAVKLSQKCLRIAEATS